MTNKLSRSEFMKSGIVAALGLLVPKFIADIGGYVTGIGRGSPHIFDNFGLTIELEKPEPKVWEVKTQYDLIYAMNWANPGDTILIPPDFVSWTPQLADHLIDNTRWILPKQYDHP